jgi:hypothetical protein
MDLLTMMDDDGDNQICQILGIIMHGHVQKLIKCKNRKKARKTLFRNTQALLKKSGYTEDEIEEI